ncbi:LlaJI family restriction endonuclease [uncultured Campylobacter sp.]|uniref:LlaJI family restriction endonuclease n=1 Tax=uncultured Campylobacter sp. TaxID=218934 RepID=UPI002629DCD3|nr:LlaJI family restriction endonuclease [uncultured Campylobacter sp.]
MNNIIDFCHINTNIEVNTFVGIKFQENKPLVCFPIGFEYDEKSARKDILLLVKTIKQSKFKINSKEVNNSTYSEKAFAFMAYVNILKDYLAYGYHKENQVEYKLNSKGKVDYTKTFKTQKSFIQDDSVYYLNFIKRTTNATQDELISRIHKFFVYESSKMIGWLFGLNTILEKPNIRFNKILFIKTIKNKLSHTFNDRVKYLFKNMLFIIQQSSGNELRKFNEYGIDRFEYVWENLVDKVYGVCNKVKYYPTTKWIINQNEINSSSLRPDTIMLYNGEIYILDSKYYKYSATLKANDLPSTSSVSKQIIYGEYVSLISNTNKIYNAFIMPFNAKKYGTNENIIKIGEAFASWKNSTKQYEKIQGILIDTKFLMTLGFKFNQKEVKRLSKIISS